LQLKLPVFGKFPNFVKHGIAVLLRCNIIEALKCIYMVLNLGNVSSKTDELSLVLKGG